jgi:hypothetical protein
MLPFASLASELPGDFTNLTNAGWTDWMSHRNQSARRIDRASAADIQSAVFEHANAMSLRT